MVDLPKISIVTPSYNQGRFIRETIESIISQDYLNLEYIIIDGESTDDTVDIIHKFEHRLAYWCSEKDEGQSDAIMKGLNRTTGELFAWVNSDDVLFPDCLRAVGEFYLLNNRPDIIHADVAYMDCDGLVTRLVRIPRQSRFLFFRGVWYGAAPAIFFKSSLLKEVGGLDKRYHLSMDLDLWIRMMKAGARIVHIRRYLGGFRWHDSTKTFYSSQTRNRYQEIPEVTEILNKNLPKSSPFSRYLWKRIYKTYQVLNLNYIFAYRDFRKLKGPLHWLKATQLLS